MTPEPDLAEFEALDVGGKDRKPCAVARGMASLDEQAQAQVTIALGREYKPGTIEKWFKARGAKVSSTAVSNHRRQRCACYE